MALVTNVRLFLFTNLTLPLKTPEAVLISIVDSRHQRIRGSVLSEFFGSHLDHHSTDDLKDIPPSQFISTYCFLFTQPIISCPLFKRTVSEYLPVPYLYPPDLQYSPAPAPVPVSVSPQLQTPALLINKQSFKTSPSLPGTTLSASTESKYNSFRKKFKITLRIKIKFEIAHSSNLCDLHYSNL